VCCQRAAHSPPCLNWTNQLKQEERSPELQGITSLRLLQSLPFQQLQVLRTLFSEFFASFPYGTCALSIFCRYLALGGVYHPSSGCTLKQPYSSTAFFAGSAPSSLLASSHGILTLSDAPFHVTWSSLRAARRTRRQATSPFISIVVPPALVRLEGTAAGIFGLGFSLFTRRY